MGRPITLAPASDHPQFQDMTIEELEKARKQAVGLLVFVGVGYAVVAVIALSVWSLAAGLALLAVGIVGSVFAWRAMIGKADTRIAELRESDHSS